ncbi:MAG: hypothetical protein V8R40_14590 [Dysosmobacter sp.]
MIETAKEQMNDDSVRFEDVLTELEAKRQALEKQQLEADRLYRQREEDARKAREFREQMERAKENARSRGEAEAKRIRGMPGPRRTRCFPNLPKCARLRPRQSAP